MSEIRGVIFDIQHYAIYDGPGIRSVVFFKGCPLSCAWCHNPESRRIGPEIGFLADRCARCGACVAACPSGAVLIGKGGIVRDGSICTACGACAAVCPSGATQLIGREMTPREIVGRVAGDRPFYESSGGGVTISGGEATMQARFLIETLTLLKEYHIHTALETSGAFPSRRIDDLTGTVDLFLYDIKGIDPKAHRTFTGVGTDVILDNFTRILSRVGERRIVPRIPLIPGFNTDGRSTAGIIDFLTETGYRGPVHLMPYNRMAKSKWEKVGRGAEYRDMGELTDGVIEKITERLQNTSFEPIVNH